MSVPSPWSVKGVQPKAREAAKDLARREGLTLGEWLNRLIGDVDEDGEAASSPRSGTLGHQSPHTHNQQPAFPATPGDAGIHGPASASIPKGHFMSENPAAAQNWPARDNDNSRLTAALEQLTRRLDLVGGPPQQAPIPAPPPQYAPPHAFAPEAPLARSADRFATDIMERVEMSERRTESVIGRVDASLADVRQTQAALNERLRTIEATDPNSKSLIALRSLETALNRLSQQVFDVDARAEAIQSSVEEKLASLPTDAKLNDRFSQVENQARQSVDLIDQKVQALDEQLAAKAAEQDQSQSHVFEALDNLSARLAHAEDNQDSRLESFDARIQGMSALTTQAIESVDKGLGLVSERVAATEALAQATNERLVEALADLSDRLGHLESIDSQEAARDLLSAIEAKNKELARRLEMLDQKIDTTRLELTQEVQSAVATGVDGQMADIAKALADRLDASERRNGETLERIGAEMARASISLDQRIRELEERGTEDIAASMRAEMAKMTEAIDARMATMARRDSTARAEAGGQFEQLARALSDKLDASEARAQSAVKTVSSQMEQLALRLQARQEEASHSLAVRVEESRVKGQEELKDSLAHISSEIRSAEERAKAATEPLRREVSAMIERLDHVESRGLTPFSEAIGFGDPAVTISDFDDVSEPYAPKNKASSPSLDAFAPDYIEQDVAPQGSPGQARFGAAFPDATAGNHRSDGGHSHLAQTPNFDEPFSNDLVEDPLANGGFDAKGQGGSARVDLSQGSGFDEFVDGLDEEWSSPSRSTRGGQDYLTKARQAASNAAAEAVRAVAQAPKKKSSLKDSPIPKGQAKKPSRVGIMSSAADIFDVSKQDKPLLSPVGIAAAAGLVIALGVMGYSAVTKDKGQDEKPAALATPPAPEVPATPPVEGDATPPSDASALPEASTTPPAGATEQKPVSALPTEGNPQVGEQVSPQTPVAAVRKPDDARRFAALEQDNARRAVAKSNQIAARLKQPAAKGTLQGKPPAQKSASGGLAVPQVANSQTRVKVPPSAKSMDARSPAPRVAVAGQARNTSGMSAKQLYDQAVARQQAGDATGAFALMRSAADSGDARAMNRLAKMYERGEGVARDRNQARALTEQAAQKGSRQAIHNLGVYYAEGEGNQRDMSKAAENFRKAAVKGVTDSQFNLGAMAEQGLGTQRSEREAYYWYSVASRSGDRDAVAKTRELAARLPAAERAAEDQRVSQFAPEASGED